MESFEISIPTFVNPHLFWVVKSDDKEKSTLNELMCNIDIKQSESDTYFEVGEVIAVSYENKYYRAIIEDVKDGYTNQLGYYLCWLMDYGVMLETETVYKLPTNLKTRKALAMQASLNNILYTKANLTFDEEGQAKTIIEPVSAPTSLIHHISFDLIANAKKIEIIVEDIVDDVLLGDVLFKTGNEMESLRQTLIDRGVLMIDNMRFHELHEDIFNYRETQLVFINQICRNLNLQRVLHENNNCKTKCQNIISKYLKEFDNHDMFDDDEILVPFKNRRSRSRHSFNNSNNTLTSENESVSDSDLSKKFEEDCSNNSSGNKSETRNRQKLLLHKLKEHYQKLAETKNNKEESLTDDNSRRNGNKTKISPLVSIKQKMMEQLKTKKLELSSRRDEDLTNSVEEDSTTSPEEQQNNFQASPVEKNSPNAQTTKRLLPRNTVFVPGGASYTLKGTMATSTPKSRRAAKTQDKIELPSVEESDSTPREPDESPKDAKFSSTDGDITEESKSDGHALPADRVGQLQIKPHCSCKQCDHWAHETDWQTHLSFHEEENCVKRLTIEQPQTLFKKDERREEERHIMSLDFSSTSKVQKQAMQKLIVHGECVPHPITLVAMASLHEDIHRRLRQLEYSETKRIQMYTWPSLLRYQHVCMISGPESGKTMGYLPVMLSFLLEKNERYQPLLKMGGPIFVVLCTSTKKCEEVYDLAKLILQRSKARVTLITYPLAYINASHIDFLITTPSVLVDLLKSNAVTFKRLCHLILEDGDKMVASDPDVAKVLSLTQNVLEHRLCPKPVQLVICGEHWNSRLEALLKRLDKMPIVCVGNHLEAALYGKVEFSMRFVNSACKEHELKFLLKDTHKICKSVIVCKKNEVEDIQTILMLKGIDATVITEDMTKEAILYMEQVWTQCKGGQYSVLVCTDFILNTILTVTSASLLIHYSLPTSWTKFVKRFGCLLESCKSPLDTTESKITCQSVVLCDEDCEQNLPRFFRFIDATELRHQLPDKFKTFSKDLKDLDEEKKLQKNVGLCETLKLFGSCPTFACPRRHALDRSLDVSKHLPESGTVKFKILHVEDVTKYSVELIQHVGKDGKVHEFEDLVDVSRELADALKASRKRPVNFVVGHLYAYVDELEGLYHRCDLLEVDSECAKVKLIDRGSVVKTVKSRLYKLPEEFKDSSKPRKVYDVFLANLIPPYRDGNFSARSYRHLNNLLEKHDYKNIILTGVVHLQLGNALWLKNVYQELVLSDRVIPGLQLTREILSSKLASYSQDQLAGLYSLCRSAGIELPTYEKEQVKAERAESKVEPQWAHLDSDAVSEVILSAAVSPDEVYFRLNKFNHLLYMLQKEIRECLKKPNYPKLKHVEPGTVCLAKDLEGEYSRVIVRNRTETDALCFFVDFGDEQVVKRSELRYIQNILVAKLPFQTIQCRLRGLKPTLSEWQSDVVDVLYEYSMEPNTDIFRSLYVKPCGREQNVLLPGQKRYAVLLKDGFGEKRALVNSLLIDCGLASPIPDEELVDFEIPESCNEAGETDEEVEKVIGICRTEEAEQSFCPNKFDPDKQETEAQDDDMELVLINPLAFFEEFIFRKREEPQTAENRELPTMRVASPVDYCTPEVLWWQTENCVKMDIKLPDVEKYNLNLLKRRILHFTTMKSERTYMLKLMLYEPVDTIQHALMGPQIRVTLTKSKNIEWPRLILSKERARNIRYDVSKIEVQEDKKKRVLDLGISDDEDSVSEENDIMYHVVSDLDSDLDFEIQHDSDS